MMQLITTTKRVAEVGMGLEKSEPVLFLFERSDNILYVLRVVEAVSGRKLLAIFIFKSGLLAIYFWPLCVLWL